MKKFGQIFIGLSFVIAVTGFFILLDQIGWTEIKGILGMFELWHFGLFLLIGFFYHFFFALRLNRILNLKGHRVPFSKMMSYVLAGFSVSYFTPSADLGGEPVMGYLLSKNDKDISFMTAFSSAVANKVLVVSSNFIYLIVALFYIMFRFVLPTGLEFHFYSIAAIFGLALVLIYMIIITSERPLELLVEKMGLFSLDIVEDQRHKLKEFDSVFVDVFRNNPLEFFILIFYGLCSSLSTIVIAWAAGHFIGLDIGFLDAVVIQTVLSVAQFIPVPATIGVLEGGETAIFSVLGFSAAAGFGVSLIYKFVNIFYSLIGFACLFYKGIWDDLRSKVLKKVQNVS